MPRPIHFDITADDPKRVVDFYNKIFGWKFYKWDGSFDYWLITTGDKDAPGIDGGLSKREDQPANIINTIDVPSVDEYSEKITSEGGTITVPKMAIPGVGYIAYFHDTEGNTFGIIEDDTTAK